MIINGVDDGIDENTNIWDVPGFATISEYPFIREDMTWGEYWEERKYFVQNYQDYRMGIYKPLWKQKSESGN